MYEATNMQGEWKGFTRYNIGKAALGREWELPGKGIGKAAVRQGK